LSPIILKKIEEVQKSNIPIEMIAPSHGIIWRRDPSKIMNAYVGWSKNTVRPKVVVAYETMWGATDAMARKIAEGLVESGLEVKLFDVAQSDRTEVVNQMLDARGFLIGSSTHDNDMLPTIAGFLEFLKGLKPKNRISAAFGSFGWAGGAVKNIESVLKEGGIEVVQAPLSFQYMPDVPDIKACYEWGKSFAQEVLKRG
jgi:flavorubredoxin